MQLLIVRHAIAKDREKTRKKGISEGDRPLTERGEKKFRKTAELLNHLEISIDLCFVSPWLRAQQTAEILEQHVRVRDLKTVNWLLPETAFDVTHKCLVSAWIEHKPPNARPSGEIVKTRTRSTSTPAQKRRPVIAIVGHEPHLSEVLMSYLKLPLPWDQESVPDFMRCIRLEKGAIAQLEFAEFDFPRPANGILRRLICF